MASGLVASAGIRTIVHITVPETIAIMDSAEIALPQLLDDVEYRIGTEIRSTESDSFTFNK